MLFETASTMTTGCLMMPDSPEFSSLASVFTSLVKVKGRQVACRSKPCRVDSPKNRISQLPSRVSAVAVVVKNRNVLMIARSLNFMDSPVNFC
jgi:hypothetical protein